MILLNTLIDINVMVVDVNASFYLICYVKLNNQNIFEAERDKKGTA